MASNVTLKAVGLNYSPNNLSLPEGSLVEANDVIIRRDNVVESRRGLFEYSNNFTGTAVPPKQILTYKDRILSHYASTLDFDTKILDTLGKSIFASFSGSFSEVATGLRMKFIEANKNLYFTTSDGIKKISARTANDFTTAANFIVPSGGIKALDFTANLVVTQGETSGFLPVDSTIAYRHLWGYKDLNNNLILGTPSNSIPVYNYLSEIVPLDINNLILQLDNITQSSSTYHSVINNGITTPLAGPFTFSNLFKTNINDVGSTFATNVINIATYLDQYSTIADINAVTNSKPLQIGTFALTNNVATITFSSGDPTTVFTFGDVIAITGAVDSGGNLYSAFNNPSGNNNFWRITSVTSTTITFNFSHADITSGSPGTSTKIFPYTFRNIINTPNPNGLYVALTDPTFVVETPATSLELRTIEDAINRIIIALQSRLKNFISNSLFTQYLQNLSITQAANVDLNITIPESITSTNNASNEFVQVYRTRVFTAQDTQVLGTDVVPDDEMRLVFEGFPTPTDLAAGFINYFDNYPDDLRNTNANLYTNPTTGEGIDQANDIPPIAQDINRFKNVLFFANTKTRHRINPFQLLGISNITSTNNNNKITFSNGTTNITLTFNPGIQQVTNVQIKSNTLANFLGNYWTINSGTNINKYYVWYRVDNAGTDPAPKVGGVPLTGIRIDLLTGDSITNIRDKTLASLNSFALDFTIIPSITYTFTLSSPSTASIGDIYTNNGNKYTVLSNIVSASTLICSGNSNPTSSGNLTRSIGSGTNSIPFSSFVSLNNGMNITNTLEGITTNAADFNIGGTNIAITTTTTGAGEDILNKKVLLSSVGTRAQQIDVTARSLVRVINEQSNTFLNAYYVSGSNSSPGIINLESISLGNIAFYVLGSNTGIGTSFNPDISPTNLITAITSANPAVITSTAHGLTNLEQIMISGSNSGVSIDGIWNVTVIDANHFSVPVNNSSIAGTTGAWASLANTNVSNNETKPNRIYYSKLSQPEAVPLLNYFDVGSQDAAILRIFPLRDSLFVFKEDGLYRISGEIAPFVVTLFDSSIVLTAPDSVAIANNIIYGWTTKGISNVTEAGANEITRPIDTQILKLSSANYPNFSTLTWGVGYDSDNSYTVFTNSSTDDTVPTIGFRYSNLTNTWTNIQRSQNCGAVLPKEDVLYMGAGDLGLIHRERKTLTRLDYADKDFTVSLTSGSTFDNGLILQLDSISNISVGDVVIQNQYLTIFGFNSLLQKLDFDTFVGINNISSTTGAGTTITVHTTTNHGLNTNDYVVLSGTNSSPVINGTYQIVVISPTSYTITIPSPLLVQASTGFSKRSYALSIPAITGDNLRDDIVKLASYLDTDPVLTPITPSYSSMIANKFGSITSNSIGSPTNITAAVHGLINGRVITITGSNSSPIIDGTYSVTVVDANTFSVPINVTTPGTTGSWTTSNTLNQIEDIVVCYNAIISKLNDSASGTRFKNYVLVDDTNSSLFEAVILNVNNRNKQITVNLPLQWVVGDLQIFKAIPCHLVYAPITFGNPLQLKHIYESTLMFNNKAFTVAKAGYSTDLKPEFSYDTFYGQGNGIFGHYSNPGFGYGFFGGSSNSAPFRTIIPRDAQRCRYMNVSFDHQVAREIWSLYGITLTKTDSDSNRAYR